MICQLGCERSNKYSYNNLLKYSQSNQQQQITNKQTNNQPTKNNNNNNNTLYLTGVLHSSNDSFLPSPVTLLSLFTHTLWLIATPCLPELSNLFQVSPES